MKRRNVAVLTSLAAVVVLVALAVLQPAAQAAPQPKGLSTIHAMVQLGTGADGTPTTVEEVTEAISSTRSGFNVDSFFDITYIANVKPNGLDEFDVDSFFDITYRLSPESDTEMVALSLHVRLDNPDNPGGALDALRQAVAGAGGRLHYGHVTVLK